MVFLARQRYMKFKPNSIKQPLIDRNHITIFNTEKPWSNESEGTKDFVLYSRFFFYIMGFVIEGLF
jgi:hypothetical protein